VDDDAAARCARCAAALAERQRWCLQCGYATLTRIAPAPRWRATAAGAVLIAAVALSGIGYALATLASS
jgi:ribosomal protein L37E